MKFKEWVSSLFKDSNDINEKSVLGFASFFMMIIFAVSDIITGTIGKSLVINETIFNSFLIMTLGSLGIASVDKYITTRNNNNSNNNDTSQKNNNEEENY